MIKELPKSNSFFVSITLICQTPSAKKGGTDDVRHLFIVYLIGGIRRHVTIRVSLCVIPHNGNSVLGKPGVVTTADGLVPCTIIGDEGEATQFHILFKPIAESGMRGRIEIGYMLGIVDRSATDHIKVHIGRNMR